MGYIDLIKDIDTIKDKLIEMQKNNVELYEKLGQAIVNCKK